MKTFKILLLALFLLVGCELDTQPIEKYKNKLAEGLAFLNITASDEQ